MLLYRCSIFIFFYGPSSWSSLLLCFFYFFNFFTSLLLLSIVISFSFWFYLNICYKFFFISSLLSVSFHVPGVMHYLCSCFLKTIILSLAFLDVSLAFCQCSSIFITALLKFTQGSCNLQIYQEIHGHNNYVISYPLLWIQWIRFSSILYFFYYMAICTKLKSLNPSRRGHEFHKFISWIPEHHNHATS